MEFEKIISIYNIIPYIKNKKSKITYIKPYKKKDLYMVIDPNYSEDRKCDYIKVKELCKKCDLKFCNQTFNGLISQARDKFYDESVKRHKFTKVERESFFSKS